MKDTGKAVSKAIGETIGTGKKVTLNDDPGFATEKYLTLKMSSMKDYDTFQEQLKEFREKKMKEGTHYGKSYPNSDKRNLLQPGADAFCKWLQIEPIFVPDIRTWEMYGSKTDRVCYVCFLLTSERKARAIELICSAGVEFSTFICSLLAMGEGRACGNLGEKSNSTDNDIVKRTQKRSLVDAVLRVGCMHEYFDQDAEDGVIKPDENKKAKAPSNVKKADKEVIDIEFDDDDLNDYDETLDYK